MSKKDEMHRELATQCFNGVWNLLEKRDRSKDDDAQMIRMAHTSRFHWGEIGTALEFARGDWQISRVYDAVLGFGVMAYKYAKTSLTLCEENGFGDFDLAFAYEALARACAVSGDMDRGRDYISLAKDAAAEIEKEEDREYFFSELESVSEIL